MPAELPSARGLASRPLAGRRWDDLPGEGAPGRDYDQLPVRGADCEGTGVRLLKDAQHVGHRLAVTRCGPTPADHDPLADVGRCEPDLVPVAHCGIPLRPSIECSGHRDSPIVPGKPASVQRRGAVSTTLFERRQIDYCFERPTGRSGSGEPGELANSG
jgi:hypothetical protein